MADQKVYLNVPFAEKDAAKSLGARWDPANKKWYVAAGKDLSLFAKWQASATELVVTKQQLPVLAKAGTGVFTYPADPNFVAYNGELPPWA